MGLGQFLPLLPFARPSAFSPCDSWASSLPDQREFGTAYRRLVRNSAPFDSVYQCRILQTQENRPGESKGEPANKLARRRARRQAGRVARSVRACFRVKCASHEDFLHVLEGSNTIGTKMLTIAHIVRDNGCNRG